MNARSTILSITAAGACVFALAACGSNDNSSTSTSSASTSTPAAASTTASTGKSGKIALLLPESKTPRYESQDKPNFEKKLMALCPSCQIIYSNADQDASKQQDQADAAITNGAKVLVLDPVDSASAASIAIKAKQQNIPVISYDRLITGAPVDYYISFDNVKVGTLQGQALATKLKAEGNPTGPIIQINGAPTDNNAKLFKQGATAALKAANIKVLKNYDTPDWSPDKAQTEAEQAITAVGKNNIKGIYSANDGMGGGIVAAEKGQGLDPTKVPLTGQDADLDGIQRILSGEQYVDVYKAIKPEAEAAATLAYDLLNGKTPDASMVNGKTDNGSGQIPSVLLTPVAVTKDNVNSTIVKDGFWTVAQICTPQFKADCAAAGIS